LADRFGWVRRGKVILLLHFTGSNAIEMQHAINVKHATQVFKEFIWYDPASLKTVIPILMVQSAAIQPLKLG